MNMDLGSWSVRVAAAIRAGLASQRRTARHSPGSSASPSRRSPPASVGQITFDLVELERVAGWLGLTPSELVARADERAA